MATREALFLEPGAGAGIPTPIRGYLTYKVRGEQSDGAMTFLEIEVPPDRGPRLHVHEHKDEAVYVLEGELWFRLGDDLHSATAGAFVFVSRGTAHCFQNTGSEPARILAVFTPSGIEQFFDSHAATISEFALAAAVQRRPI